MKMASSFTVEEKEFFMREALREAGLAQEKGEVPIGAVVIHKGEIIGRGHNLRETTQNAITHAEMLAIQEACDVIGSWRLEDCQMFVTLEPCIMCSGALILSRVDEVYYGAADLKGGGVESLYHLLTDQRLNHRAYVEKGVLEEECRLLLKNFFRALRQKKKGKKGEE
ncbi:tRNA adenosine(34) deaminase TadA [Vagococcus elongatus]|uniref:tRNA-specific adenosine deaminase n=1 Tax=Vagococcus elongatus TaxID=180344 RepID=A0A430AN91_9ENTE|nr:tRNA adenosine(34) deaminase TadA [Vagococcus elongatus]RSU09443.1 tRNA-specific adenosine deaminase [Vagococcus elongatus]